MCHGEPRTGGGGGEGPSMRKSGAQKGGAPQAGGQNFAFFSVPPTCSLFRLSLGVSWNFGGV